jgi:hypothetical protein
MLVVETIGRIRREHLVKGKSIKEIARAARFVADSPVERDGFEPSVPRKPPDVVFVSINIRADFSVRGIKQRRHEPLSNSWWCRFKSGFLQRGVSNKQCRRWA